MTTEDESGLTIIKFGVSGVDTHEVELTFNQNTPSPQPNIAVSGVTLKACYAIGAH